MNRVKIGSKDNKLRIEIRSYNSMLHAFFVLLIITAVASFMNFILPGLSMFTQRFLFVWIGKAVMAVFIIVSFALIVRSIFWTIGGREIIEAGGGNFTYYKGIFNIGRRVSVPFSEITDVKVIDYVQEKDILHMIKSELNFAGKSFQAEYNDKKLRFGAYLTVEQVEEIERVLFPAFNS